MRATGCTTERRKTHKTDSAEVLYAWHPFYGQEVTIHGERNRRGTVVFVCSIGEDPRTAPLEVPAWMLDAAVCRIFRPGPRGRVTVEALRLLRRTLDVNCRSEPVSTLSVFRLLVLFLRAERLGVDFRELCPKEEDLR